MEGETEESVGPVVGAMRIYFFLVPPGPPEDAGYEHGLIALAEGFQSLGHFVAGNRNSWSIPQTEESANQFDLVLISHESWLPGRGLPHEYLAVKGPVRIYVDQSDGWRTEASTQDDFPADLVLRAHYQGHHIHPSRVRPWAFGLTRRMIEVTANGLPTAKRAPVVLCNFRVGHPVRDRLTAAFRHRFSARWIWDERIDTAAPSDPEALRLWRATGRRHNPAYYQRLCQAQGCLAFGGFFLPSASSSPLSFAGRLGYRAIQTLGLRTDSLGQYDSWRFWESLASGCVTVHGPLANWGARFPTMPEDGRHYVSFDPRESASQFLARWETCLEADVGRSWAIENYGPEASARRLLEWIA